MNRRNALIGISEYLAICSLAICIRAICTRLSFREMAFPQAFSLIFDDKPSLASELLGES